jgi:hypothetical protein
MGGRPACEVRQQGTRRMHRAPEIDVEQPFHLRLVDLVKQAEQRDAGVVDQDVQRRVAGDRIAHKAGNRLRVAHIDAVQADFSRRVLGNVGCNRLKSGFVAIGKREISPPCGKLDSQRTADAARSTRDGHGGSSDRSHLVIRF